MKIPEKARKMINYLREQICIGHFGAESKLPPIRDLQQQFNLSYTSAKRGIDYLCEIGIAEKRPRSGVYVKKTLPSSKSPTGRKITLFVSGSELRKSHDIYSTVFWGIQYFAEEHRCSLSINYLPVADVSSDLIANAGKGTDGMIFLAEYDTSLSTFSTAIPAVGICMHNSLGGKLSLVDIDPYQSAKLAVAYFQKKRVSNISIISKQTLPCAYKNREDVFANLWSQSSRKLQRRDISENFSLDSDTGYFFATSSMLQFCSEKSLLETGKTLAERVVVLGVDGKNLINPEFHNAPAIALDWKLVGKYAMEECLYRINNPGSLPKRIYLPGTLVENNL